MKNKKLLLLSPMLLIGGSLIGCGGGNASSSAVLAINAPRVSFVGDIDKSLLTVYEVKDGKTTLVKPEDLTLSVTKFDQRSDEPVFVTVTSKSGAKGSYTTKVYDVDEVDKDMFDNYFINFDLANSGEVYEEISEYDSDLDELILNRKSKYKKLNNHELYYKLNLKDESNKESWEPYNLNAFEKFTESQTGKTMYYDCPAFFKENSEEIDYVLNVDIGASKAETYERSLFGESYEYTLKDDCYCSFDKLTKNEGVYSYSYEEGESSELTKKEYLYTFKKGMISTIKYTEYKVKDKNEYYVDYCDSFSFNYDNVKEPFTNRKTLNFSFIKIGDDNKVKVKSSDSEKRIEIELYDKNPDKGGTKIESGEFIDQKYFEMGYAWPSSNAKFSFVNENGKVILVITPNSGTKFSQSDAGSFKVTFLNETLETESISLEVED